MDGPYAVCKDGSGSAWGGAIAPLPRFWQNVKPISIRGQIMPTTLLIAPLPWIFRPSYGPTMYQIVCLTKLLPKEIEIIHRLFIRNNLYSIYYLNFLTSTMYVYCISSSMSATPAYIKHGVKLKSTKNGCARAIIPSCLSVHDRCCRRRRQARRLARRQQVSALYQLSARARLAFLCTIQAQQRLYIHIKLSCEVFTKITKQKQK